ncbi:hypothetical protein [Bosea sp. (in: a-proteobacteria)]|uniref:hypothetical protein n=1 Tax=Bosea sp. (in: a-proteobacteria) TaxID=1871050 RepID=UPI002FCA1EC2
MALRARLARHGVAVVAAGSRYGAEGEGQAIYVKDPDGNAIELKGAELIPAPIVGKKSTTLVGSGEPPAS